MDRCPFGRALAAVLASWERTSDLREKDFKKPAIASQSRVFCFLNKRKKNMKKNKQFVPTEFGPETRFELRATPTAPFRATQETEFERLKNKLLAEQLVAATPELNVPLRRAANDAAALAWATVFPLLVFPVLFEEKIEAAVLRVKRQARIYANSQLVAA
jgi:hypothetical protein